MAVGTTLGISSISPSSTLRFQFMLLISPHRRSTSHIERLSISTGHAVRDHTLHRHIWDRAMRDRKVCGHFNTCRVRRKC